MCYHHYGPWSEPYLFNGAYYQSRVCMDCGNVQFRKCS